MHDAPRWFLDAVADAPQDRRVEVQGCPVHYLAWGEPGRPGLVFVHGGAAHAHWWSFIAPLFTPEYRVAAIDLSGHGDSGRRPAYPREVWAEEVLAVAEDAGFEGPPSPDPEAEEGDRGRSFRNPKVYPDEATALEHFRTVPEQPSALPWVLDFVGRKSLVRVPDGVTWKFDPVIFRRETPRAAHEILPKVRCRIALFRAQHGIVTPDIAGYMYELLGRNAPVIEIPEAYHHMMLDQPLLLVTGLRTLLADWEHSLPRERRMSREDGRKS
jgi:pimeloyl-ACP methyl ester carboxylesterase